MNISATFIHKPIGTSMLMAAILLLGLARLHARTYVLYAK